MLTCENPRDALGIPNTLTSQKAAKRPPNHKFKLHLNSNDLNAIRRSFGQY